MHSSPCDRDCFGVRVRATMIYERTLELTHKLCWNSEDLGLSRIHTHNGRSFSSRAALEAFCLQQREEPPEPAYVFDWLPSLKERSGVERQNYLRDEHWCNREQIVNILLDTAMQAYLEDTRQLLGTLTGGPFGAAELVKINISNQARQYTGAPDTAFVDVQNRTVALIEIKIGTGSTKYSLDQAVKYETLSALLRQDEFFPGFRVYKVLLCPYAAFSANTSSAHQLHASSDSEGALSFGYAPSSLAALRPLGRSDIVSLVAARLEKIMKKSVQLPGQALNESLHFFSWKTVQEATPPGDLRSNITALMRYLALGESREVVAQPAVAADGIASASRRRRRG